MTLMNFVRLSNKKSLNKKSIEIENLSNYSSSQEWRSYPKIDLINHVARLLSK